MSEMKEHPMCFTRDEVIAIRSGRKTHHHMPINTQTFSADNAPDHARWKPGDLLWMRERFVPTNTEQPLNRYTLPSHRSRVKFDFYADHPEGTVPKDVLGLDLIWQRPQFMPRWASRMSLEVVSVRVQQIGDMQAEDFLAEGTENKDRFFSRWNEKQGWPFCSASLWVFDIEFKVVQS